MTTITLQGTQVDFLNGEASSVGSAQAALIMPSASSTFSYQILGFGEGVPIVEITSDLYQIQLNGQLADDTDVSAVTSVVSVTWSGNTSVVLALSYETGPDSDTDMYFLLGGAALPDINSAADWNDFDKSITGVGAASGTYGPGVDILWTDFTESSQTEDDEFIGTSGPEVFDGGIGDDYFTSSEGSDTYNGGKGTFDQVNYRLDPNGVTINMAKGFAVDGWGDRDTLKSIEVARGSLFDDTLVGGRGVNVFRGLGGDDMINGGKGADVVRYDRDERYGGQSGVTVNLKKGFAIDGFGDRDTLKNISNVMSTEKSDTIIGNGGKNTLEGLGGNDKLFGLGGNDMIYGGNGRDKIDGGGGNDVLSGGGKADKFVFKGRFGDDTIMDFQTKGKAEKIDLSGVGAIKSFKDLANNHLSDVNGHAVIDDGNGNTITLDGVIVADLSGNDFIF